MFHKRSIGLLEPQPSAPEGFTRKHGAVDDIHPMVPLKGSLLAPIRGSCKGSIGF